MKKTNKIWKPVEFSTVWKNCDTSILDDLSASWFLKREKWKDDSAEYIELMNRLKREHAIETGIVERLYSLDIGITETFIKEGFKQSYLSHNDTNIPEDDLMNYLNDHEQAINFVFDVVKEERPFSNSFIKALHQLVCRNQKFAEGRDQFGNRLEIPLLRGKYKIRENNPTGKDGTVIKYCPPEHVDAEMDNLIRLYEEHTSNVHQLIMATWFHHAFTTIHPFQDGNGRIARLLASLIFIKYDLFPFTVNRDERVRYIKGLEQADKGEPQDLVDYFAAVQKQNIENTLDLELEFAGDSLEAVQDIFAQKVADLKEDEERKIEERKEVKRKLTDIYTFCKSVMDTYKNDLEKKIKGNAKVYLSTKTDLLNLSEYQNRNFKFANYTDVIIKFELDKSKFLIDCYIMLSGNFKIVAIAFGGNKQSHTFSIADDFEPKKKNIKKFMEKQLTIELAKIVKQL